MVNDSPLSIYKYLQLSNFKGEYIWVLKSNKHPMYELLCAAKNTKVVIYGTKEYFLAYATSKYWIVNCRIPYRVVKKAGQIFVQCWHGTPLKKMGFDIEIGDNAKVSQAGLRYAYALEAKRVDYFISPSSYASNCFISSFGLSKEQILELGYPRNDYLFNNASNLDLIKKLKLSLDIPVDKKVILYAPTWRDNSFCNKRQSHILHNPLENECFLNKFGEDIVFLYRGHYFTDLEKESSRFVDVSNYNDINDIFLISDLLITDYSSVFFDFAILNRPVLFFMHDRKEYELKTRGFYLDIDNALPGNISTLPSILADDILTALNQEHDLSAFNLCFNPYEDGSSAQRVVNVLINNEYNNAKSKTSHHLWNL